MPQVPFLGSHRPDLPVSNALSLPPSQGWKKMGPLARKKSLAVLLLPQTDSSLCSVRPFSGGGRQGGSEFES